MNVKFGITAKIEKLIRYTFYAHYYSFHLYKHYLISVSILGSQFFFTFQFYEDNENCLI